MAAVGPLDTMPQVVAALRRLRDSNEAILNSINMDGVKVQLAGNPIAGADVQQLPALQAQQSQLQMEIIRSKVLQLTQTHPEVAEAWNAATATISAETGGVMHHQSTTYQSDLFDWLESPGFCALATTCPCIAASCNRYNVTDGTHSGCCVCICTTYPFSAPCMFAQSRLQDRTMMDITLGANTYDIGCLPCLVPCSLTQTHRELTKHRQQGYRFVDSLSAHPAMATGCKCERCQGRYVSIPTRQLMEVGRQLEQSYPQVAG